MPNEMDGVQQTSPAIVLRFGDSALGTRDRVRRAGQIIHGYQKTGNQTVAVVGPPPPLLAQMLGGLSRGRRAATAELARERSRITASVGDLTAAVLAATVAALGTPGISIPADQLGLDGDDGGSSEGRYLTLDCRRVRRLLESGHAVVAGGGSDSDMVAIALAECLGGVACHFIGVEQERPHSLLRRRGPRPTPAWGAESLQPDVLRAARERRVPLHFSHLQARSPVN